MYFDKHIRLPTESRNRIGLRTECNWCREIIEEKFFIGAFKEGKANVMLHELCFKKIEDAIENEEVITRSFPSRIDSIE